MLYFVKSNEICNCIKTSRKESTTISNNQLSVPQLDPQNHNTKPFEIQH